MNVVDKERRDFAAYMDWVGTREWRDDLVAGFDAEARHAKRYAQGAAGYIYEDGSWIMKASADDAHLGEYRTLCPFDVRGDLETVERALWDNHAKNNF